MTVDMRRGILTLAVVMQLGATGCVYTTGGNKLPPITPPAPTFQPSVQYTVGDYEFTLEGGAMISANQAGKIVNDAIMESWKERGYIREAESVEPGQFSNAAEYHLTLSGTQYSESSIILQIISGLTFTILPYAVTQNYDVQYTIVDVKSGKTYSGSAQDSNDAYVELFLLFAFPFGKRGQERMMATMGDHLYAQLRDQGAFQSPSAVAAATETHDVPP